ncbi:MAG: hypothetical protein JW884_10945 [Deltaproteobacteria bacterium]|nr:hypothetical protein [Deltaproteobacteria bacterium]
MKIQRPAQLECRISSEAVTPSRAILAGAQTGEDIAGIGYAITKRKIYEGRSVPQPWSYLRRSFLRDG